MTTGSVQSLWPKEHGAYGQVGFPLATAFGTAGITTAGLLFAATVLALFLAHESAAVLLGLRGTRARRELRADAWRWLSVCLGVGLVTGWGTLITFPPAGRWSLAIPLGAALLLATAMVRRVEKTWHGEVSAALAFASAAVPVTMAAGVPIGTAAAVAIPFALLFVASTLAVRVVIVRVRRGGDPEATKVTRRAAFAVAGGGIAILLVLSASGFVTPWILAAAAPGLLTAAVVAARPPSPTRLRSLGWSLVAVSVVTAAIVLATV